MVEASGHLSNIDAEKYQQEAHERAIAALLDSPVDFLALMSEKSTQFTGEDENAD